MTNLTINQFFEEFKENVNYLMNPKKGIILEIKGSDYNAGTWTFLINIAIYKIVKEHDKGLMFEKPTGRGGFSDFTICRKENKNPIYYEIEHENKISEEKIKNNIEKLFLSTANHKLYITYYNEKINEKKLISLCKKYMKKKEGLLELFYAKEELENPKIDFKHISIDKNGRK